jgi:hypothetical protein
VSPKFLFIGGPSEREFVRLFDERVLARTDQEVKGALDALLHQSVGRPSASSDGVTAPDLSGKYFNAARQVLEQRLRKEAQRFSPIRWLWYLRNLPSFYWIGELQSTAAYDAALAEVLTAASSAQDLPRRVHGIGGYELNASIAAQIAKFCAGVRYLSVTHTNLRWVGKGCPFSFADSPLGSPLPSAELQQSVQLYDSRVAAHPGFLLSRTGTVVAREDSRDCTHQIVAVSRRPSVPWRSSWQATIVAEKARHEAEARFTLGAACLDFLTSLNKATAQAGVKWWPEEVPLLAGFLRVVEPLVISTLKSPFQVMRCGWVLTDRQSCAAAPEAYLDDARRLATSVFPGARFPSSISALFDEVSKITGSAWPLRPGPAIRTYGDRLCLDLDSATMLLHHLAQFRTSGGEPGRIRGLDFDRGVQAILDLSAWAPPPDLRAKVGSVIKDAKGNDVTDLDAIGLKGGTLLLVSCKSRIYTDESDQGDEAATNATANVAKEALRKWNEVKTFVKRNPRCLEGVDMSQFSLLTVVCLPHVPYVPIGPETEFVAQGLRAVVSLAELADWVAEPVRPDGYS